jgi:hypothetical protein
MKPNCICFREEDKYGGQSRVNVIATEVMSYYSELMHELQMCVETDEYVAVTCCVMLLRSTTGGEKRREIPLHEDLAKFEKLLERLPALLRVRNGEMQLESDIVEAEDATKQ